MSWSHHESALVLVLLLVLGLGFALRMEPPALRDLRLGGCSQLSSDYVCTQDEPTTLRLWLPPPATEDAFTLDWDGAPLTVVTRRSDVGVAWFVDPPSPRGALTLRRRDGARLTVEVRPPSPHFRELQARRSTGPSPSAGSVRRLVSPFVMTRYEGVRLDWRQTSIPARALEASRAGDSRGMARALAAAIDESKRAALDGDASPFFAAVGVAALREVPALLDARIGADYHGAAVADLQLRPARARELYERAIALSRLADARAQLGQSLAALAELNARGGRFTAALMVVEALDRLPAKDPGHRAQIDELIGWTKIILVEEGVEDVAPRPSLDRALDYYVGLGADALDPRGRARLDNLLLDLAIEASQRGDWPRAELLLGQLDSRSLDLEAQVWAGLVHARLLSRLGRPGRALARAVLVELLGACRDSSERTLEMRVLRELAEVEARGSNPAGELDLRDELHTIAQTHAHTQLFTTGARSGAVSSRTRDIGRHIQLELAHGRPERAMCLALDASARALAPLRADARERSVDVRERMDDYFVRVEAYREALVSLRRAPSWRRGQARHALDVSLSNLLDLLGASGGGCDAHARALDPRGALLTMFPRRAGEDGEGRWWLFVDHGGQVEVEELGQREVLAPGRLLEVFPALATVDEVRVVATGAMTAVDFTPLLERELGQPLVTRSLGLDPRPALADTPAAAVVMSVSREESAGMSGALERRGWNVQPSWAPGDPTPGLLYLGADGVWDAGAWGWGSQLDVGHGASLSATEVLAKARAPQIVILNACRAGRSSAEVIDGGMNMASAFVLAGAQLVIAPTEDVAELLARELARTLAEEMPGVDASPAERVAITHDALARLRARDPRFAAWRAWGP